MLKAARECVLAVTIFSNAFLARFSGKTSIMGGAPKPEIATRSSGCAVLYRKVLNVVPRLQTGEKGGGTIKT